MPQYQTAIGRLYDYDVLEPVIKEQVKDRSSLELVAAWPGHAHPAGAGAGRWRNSSSPTSTSPAMRSARVSTGHG